MRNTLIIQFPSVTFDRLIEIEETLIQAFNQNRKAVVDGHDFGIPTSNIFIFPKRGWDECLEIVFAYLKLRSALSEVLIIKRSKRETYEVVWPKDFAGDFERL